MSKIELEYPTIPAARGAMQRHLDLAGEVLRRSGALPSPEDRAIIMEHLQNVEDAEKALTKLLQRAERERAALSSAPHPDSAVPQRKPRKAPLGKPVE